MNINKETIESAKKHIKKIIVKSEMFIENEPQSSGKLKDTIKDNSRSECNAKKRTGIDTGKKQITIYKLRFDRDNFMSFDISSSELRSKLGADYRLMLDKPVWSDFWLELEARFYDDSDTKNTLSIPDITCWVTDRLMFNKDAKSKLQNRLNQYGEFLPVKCEGIQYYVFNVTNVVDNSVDENKSKKVIEESGYIDVKKLSFIDEKVNNNLLFKTQWNGRTNVYCNDEFKKIIEQFNYSGLVFSKDLASVF